MCAGTTLQREIYPNTRLFACSICGLAMDHHDAAQSYDKSYFTERSLSGWEAWHSEENRTRLSYLSRLMQKGRLLDIGSAEGAFLDLAREKGYGVHGVEISPDAAEMSRKMYNIPVTTGTLGDAEFRENTFDGITAFHVLEHIPDPLAFLRQVHKILVPKGALVVEVPNFASFRSRAEKENWWYIKPGEHLIHFTETTLCAMLAKAGFIPVFTRPMGGLNLTSPKIREKGQDASFPGQTTKAKTAIRSFMLTHSMGFAKAKGMFAKAVRFLGVSENLLVAAVKPRASHDRLSG